MRAITDKEIEELIKTIDSRNLLQVKKSLTNLPEDELRIKLKTLIINLGKSNMINKEEIEVLLNEDQ